MERLAKRSTTRKPVKPVRKIRCCLQPYEEFPGRIVITIGTVETDYHVFTLKSDFGKAFRLVKTGTDDVYHVLLDGKNTTCDCPGHTKHG